MSEPQSIGPYRIERELGRGGMGVVLLAEDPRLGRRVALKALPAEVEASPDRLARFDREARTLASLTHQHVGQIYGLEEADGRRYLVLEYVEGETLAERLTRGPMPVHDVLEVGAQMARGVEAAHAASIVHRDLKPANVMLTPSGEAKVLDFGLAKASDQSATLTATQSPTISMAGTPEGVTIAGAVMGTVRYMSPEQARGRPVDGRTDIWSLGVMLYEMLTGDPPFAGESAADVLGAILHTDPDLSALPADTPPTIQLLLRRMLAKDRGRRLQSVGDARVELEAALEDPSSTTLGLAGAAISAPRRRRGLAPVALAVAGLVVGAAAAWMIKPSPAPRPAHVGVPIDAELGRVIHLDVSPDGETMAFVMLEGEASRVTMQTRLYLRRLGDDTMRPAPGAEGMQSASFSPSGDRLLGWKFDQSINAMVLLAIPVVGGPAVTMLEVSAMAGFATWTAQWVTDDEAQLLSADGRRLYRVSGSGGPPREVAELSWSDGERPLGAISWADQPRYALIATLLPRAAGRTRTIGRLHWLDTETGERRLLVEDGISGRLLAEDELAYTRADGTMMTVGIDLPGGRLTTTPRSRLSGLGSVASVRPTAALFLSRDDER